MQIPHPDAGCPFAYLHLAGDVPGGGSLSAHTSVATISACSGHCDGDSNCCSFEYSWTEENCYLNTECRPTAVVWRDYYFCVKGIDLCPTRLFHKSTIDFQSISVPSSAPHSGPALRLGDRRSPGLQLLRRPLLLRTMPLQLRLLLRS